MSTDRKLTIAIDYDGTWNADPAAFETFSSMMRGRGHTVLLITQRGTGRHEVREQCREHVDRVMFARGTSKRERAEASGYAVDIWIDDKPKYVNEPR